MSGMEAGDGGEGAVASAPAPESGTGPADEAWWPVWVAPWGAVLGIASMVASNVRRPSADQAAPMLLLAMVVMVVGLILYGLMIRMVSGREQARLRRWLAGISTGVAFVGLTAFFGGFFLATMDWRTGLLPGLLSPEALLGLGIVACFGWAPILLVVTLLAHVAGRAAARDAAAAARDAGTGS